MTFELNLEIKQLEKELEMLQLGKDDNEEKELKIKEIKEIKEQKIKEIKHLQKIKETQRQIKESPSAYVPVPYSSAYCSLSSAPIDLYYARPYGMLPRFDCHINGQCYRFIGMDGESCVYERTHQFGPIGNDAGWIKYNYY